MQIHIAPGGIGTITGPFDMLAREAIAALPDTNWQYDNTPRFRASAANIAHLRATLQDARWTGDTADIDLLLRLATAGHRRVTDDDRAYGFRSVPTPGQLDAFAFARFLKYFALLCDPGTGKTKMGLDIAAAKFEADEIDCVLVIAPNGVHRQWVNEQMPKHMPDVAHSVYIYDTKTSRAANARRQAILQPDGTQLRMVFVNVEALSGKGPMEFLRAFLASGRCMIILDESTRIKNFRGLRAKRGSNRAKNIISLAPLAEVRCILTGTPVTKNLMDLFGQFYFLNPNILGFDNFYRFEQRYAIVVPAYPRAPVGVTKIAGYQNVDELLNKIAPFSIRIQKTGLPEKTFERRAVELTDEQKKHYNEMVRSFRTEIGTGTMTTTNAAARVMRLQQILSGFLPDPHDPNADVLIPQNRTASLVSFIDDIGDRQLVVWVRFHTDADIIAAAFDVEGISYVVCDGREPEQVRTARKGQFNRGEVQVCIANYDAMGTGTDGLQVTGLAVLYSHTFDAEKRWQAEDRTHRTGLQDDDCTYVELHVPHTVDDLFLSNAEGKLALADRVSSFIANPETLVEV
jgi:superfamily II DNA or RNA helicase